ncbi:MAG TPA: carboxypeptidase-like regulatory domain-containing protein, partial [Rhodothermales bacterium]|nr:carboxypeptidase-like regulatory domain-containing protein [Rhodothermales bacterium]
MKRFVWFFVVLLFMPLQDVLSQKLVRGRVLDAATGESLPAANIQIEGTYQGTITNAEGAYELRLSTLPATLVVRYIGYETTRLEVTAASDQRQDLRLQPVTYEMEEVVVSGENPAIQIMREVIERKKVWRAALETYETEAYNR